jgi:hypothetical protein
MGVTAGIFLASILLKEISMGTMEQPMRTHPVDNEACCMQACHNQCVFTCVHHTFFKKDIIPYPANSIHTDIKSILPAFCAINHFRRDKSTTTNTLTKKLTSMSA